MRLKVENGEILTPAEKTVEVGPKANVPVYWTFRPREAGFTQLLMTGTCKSWPASNDRRAAE